MLLEIKLKINLILTQKNKYMKINLKQKFEKLESGKIRITSRLGQVLEMTEAEFKIFTFKNKKYRQKIKRANQQY